MDDLAARIAALSPEKLALLARRLGAKPSLKTPIPRLERSPDTRVPASFAQERLWFLDQFQPGTAVYNIPQAIRVRVPLHGPALEDALAEVVRRHETLRTTFAALDGRPVQVVAPVLRLTLPVVDLRHLPPAIREAE